VFSCLGLAAAAAARRACAAAAAPGVLEDVALLGATVLDEDVAMGATAAIVGSAAAGAIGRGASATVRAAAAAGLVEGGASATDDSCRAPAYAPTIAATARLAPIQTRLRFARKGGFAISGSSTSAAVGLFVEVGPLV
jgi:hypothetical protein